MTRERELGPVADIADGGARAYPAAPGCFSGLFAIRRGNEVRVFVNACPHLGVPLDIVPGRFLSADASHIVCATHGAQFRPEDGYCYSGPCIGDHLESVPVRIVDGVICVPADAGV